MATAAALDWQGATGYRPAMSQIDIRAFSPADRDWLAAAHAQHYARDAGFDDSFGVLVAQILDEFIAQHDLAAERGWIAWAGDVRLGSVFCVRPYYTTVGWFRGPGHDLQTDSYR